MDGEGTNLIEREMELRVHDRSQWISGPEYERRLDAAKGRALDLLTRERAKKTRGARGKELRYFARYVLFLVIEVRRLRHERDEARAKARS